MADSATSFELKHQSSGANVTNKKLMYFMEQYSTVWKNGPYESNTSKHPDSL